MWYTFGGSVEERGGSLLCAKPRLHDLQLVGDEAVRSLAPPLTLGKGNG